MNKKQAYYLATLAARETFKKTFEKLAQERAGEVIVQETKRRPQYDPSRSSGGEILHDRDGKKMNNNRGGLGGSRVPSNSKSFDVGKADDNDCDCDCDDCDCNDKKKEASANIMRIAAAYARNAR
jgi:hypothetical protein